MRANPYASGPLPPKKPRNGQGLGYAWVIVVLVVLCTVGGLAALTLIPVGLRADNTEPPPPVWAQQSASPAAEIANTLVVPINLGNRRLTDIERYLATEPKIKRVMSFVPGATDVFSATYASPANDSSIESAHLVTFAATMIRPALRGTALVQDPFDRLPEHAGIRAANIIDVLPGPLEGQAQCGKVNIDGYPTIACAWADRFTVGLVIFYGSTVEEASAEFITVRGLVEQRG